MKMGPVVLLAAIGGALLLWANSRKQTPGDLYGPPIPPGYLPPASLNLYYPAQPAPSLFNFPNPFEGMDLLSLDPFKPKVTTLPGSPIMPIPLPVSATTGPAMTYNPPLQVAGNSWAPPAAAAPYLALIAQTERANGIPHNLLARLIYQESGFRQDIIDGRVSSHAGAKGIAQVMPLTAAGPGYGAPILRNPLNPAEAIPWAGKYLAGLYRAFGSWQKALAAYNMGPGNLNNALRNGAQWLAYAPTETQNYVTQITRDVRVS